MFFAANTVVNPQNASPLASLAAEIRILIYIMVFKVANTPYGSTKLTKRPTISENRRKTTPSSVLSLLVTSRLFYQEAELYFYKLNNLEIVDIDPIWQQGYDRNLAHWHWQWWDSLTTTRWFAVQAITVRIETTNQALSVFRFLRTLPDLRKITLFVTGYLAISILGDDFFSIAFKRTGSDFFAEVTMFKGEMGIQIDVATPVCDEDDEHVRTLHDKISAA